MRLITAPRWAEQKYFSARNVTSGLPGRSNGLWTLHGGGPTTTKLIETEPKQEYSS